jgi:hypothetical protein
LDLHLRFLKYISIVVRLFVNGFFHPPGLLIKVLSGEAIKTFEEKQRKGMQSWNVEDRCVQVGIDDDGAAVFIDSASVRTHGLRLDRVEVTVIVRPVEKSDGLRAIQELLLRANKAQEGGIYVEQSWVLHLPRRLFSVRSLTVKNGEDVALHSVPLSSIDLSAIEPGSVADQVSQAVEKLVQDQSVVLQRPDASPPWEPPRPRMAPPLRSGRDVSNFGVPGDQTE